MESNNDAIKLSQKVEKDWLHLRPFVCDGNPFNCQVFIVGFNPATTIENSKFTDFFSDGVFDKEKFTAIYQSARTEQRKKAGKDENKLSKTRKGIDFISTHLEKEGIKTLETNVYFKPTSKAKELKKEDRNANQFLELLSLFKSSGNPKVIFIHGGKTLKTFVKMLKLEGDFEVKSESIGTHTFKLNNQNVTLLWTYHLSFQKMATEEMRKKVVDTIKKSVMNPVS
ncbi:hypothetical protein QWY31_08800 [Cytophagales bacterium LB-30]|uniref:Uracil-DNA glycosylase-like domain-containing protein n=1 Tax=Shiella aurantiaca TaxID=3058365 RepID=A0ABT8F554_9BACT|nr:uracil-DNA glycosylase family protein [Shiella aurantiaca]MDN4165598.1 hypothetical protein [Shiella aurantiaca]